MKAETDLPERLGELRQVCLELPDGCERVVRIRSARGTAKGMLMQFEGCADRRQAEALSGAWVKIRPSMAAPLAPGSYYVHQIVGLRVRTTEGREIGEVTEVIRSPANDVYVVPGPCTGKRAGGEVMIPAVREFVKEINLEQGVMVVEMPEEEGAESGRPEDGAPTGRGQ